jgi:hypothetical protein
MSNHVRMTIAAGLAVALACAAFAPMFSGSGWASTVLGAVLVVVLAGLAGRSLRLPRCLQPLLGLLVLAGYLVVVFADGTLTNGLPTGATWDALQRLLEAGNADVQRYRAPVPTSQGLLLMTSAGTGLVAVVVDTLAVGLRRAGLAGLPLLALFAVPAAVVPGGIGGFAFVLGAAGWLLLLGVEGHDTISRWGAEHSTRTAEGSLGRLGRRIGISALGVAVVVPLLIPGLDKTLIGGSGTGEGPPGSSSAQTFNPITRLRSELSLPTAVELFQYRTDDPSPDYIRLTTLDRFDGNGWSASPLTARRDDAQVQKGIRTPRGEDGPHQELSMRFAVKNALDVFWLPLPYGPRQVDVKGTWLWDPASQTAFSASRTTRGLGSYDVTAQRVLPDRLALSQAGFIDVDPAIATRYGTPLPVSNYVRSVTAQVVAGQRTPYTRAAAIQQFFTNQDNEFFYDLSPSVPREGQDPLEAFLRGRHGFCEQYATAMAVMLRVAGVPSRVAVGFTHGSATGSSAAGNRTYSVTTHDAHAWPEAWFAGTGWVRFEPTPGESGSTIPDYTLTPTVAPQPGQTPGAQNGQPSATPTPAGSRLEKDLEGSGSSTKGVSAAPGTRWGRWATALVILLLLAAAPALLTLGRRRIRWRRSGPLTAWEQLVDDAQDVGHRWHSGDSPRTAARRLASARRLPDPARAALERVAVAAELARYSGRPPADSGHLARDVATVRTALHRGCARSTRWRAQACPPSTLRWATGRAGDLFEATADHVEDRIARLRQLFPGGSPIDRTPPRDREQRRSLDAS